MSLYHPPSVFDAEQPAEETYKDIPFLRFVGRSIGGRLEGSRVIFTTVESFRIVKLSVWNDRLSPFSNRESRLSCTGICLIESPDKPNSFNESFANESVGIVSLGVAEVLTGVTGFWGAGFGFSILNCTGTEYLQRTLMPLSRAGIQLGIWRIAVSAAESISARKLRTTVGLVIVPSFLPQTVRQLRLPVFLS